MEDRLKHALNGTSRSGKSQLIKHLKGLRITRSGAISAKCYDCNGLGEQDVCEDKYCPLFGYSPYNKNR